MMFVTRIFAMLVFLSSTTWTPFNRSANAEEYVCRYCAEGLAHAMPLGVELDGRYHYAPDRQVDVLHIKLDVTPDFAKRTVTGTTSITATPISKPVEILRLDATDLDIHAIRCDGAKVLDHVSSRKDLSKLG